MLVNREILTQDSKLKGLVNLEADGYAIPFESINEVINKLQYGEPNRVMFKMLFYSGCHIIELDMMQKSLLHEDGTFFFRVAKKRIGKLRKVKLPMDFIEELRYYWNHYLTYSDRMFGIGARTFVRYWNRDVRPRLSYKWNEKRPTNENSLLVLEYVLQLKGMRHTYATVYFAKFYKKYGDAYVAAELVSKLLLHSTKSITIRHYFSCLEVLGKELCELYDPMDILDNISQKRMLDY